jgi:hypothetical protein
MRDGSRMVKKRPFKFALLGTNRVKVRDQNRPVVMDDIVITALTQETVLWADHSALQPYRHIQNMSDKTDR